MSSLLPSTSYPGICDAPYPHMLFFSEAVPQLVYYSHLPISLIAIALGTYVLYKNPKETPNRALFSLTLSFALWVLLDSIFWASNRGDVTTFVWSLQILFEPLMYMSGFYLIYSLIKSAAPSFFEHVILFILYLPVVLFVPTKLMLYAYDENTCYSLEGPLATYYTYGMELVILVWILLFAVYEIYKRKGRRAEIALLTAGMTSLLGSFSFGNIIGSFTGNWKIVQIALFMMPIFMIVLVYSIIRYGTMRIRLFTTAMLTFGLVCLNFSLIFIAQTITTRVVAIFTFFLTTIFSIFIVRSVKKEIAQRVEIERLATSLKEANGKLKVLDKMKSEFVSIASHQLRSPLTSIRGYASMLAEGSYGKLTTKGQEVVERIGESAKYMALSVEDYLNVSRIEAGNMKYELSEFNLKEITEKIADEMRQAAIKKGLVLVFRSDCSGNSFVRADIGKIRQVIMNIIDNSIKYTPKGTITVVIHDDIKKKKVCVTVSDTGVGMSTETQGEVFEKFVRAKNANNVNVTGTGLGLFVARKMITDMNGKIWAESEGEGSGSSFHIELPLLSGKPSLR